VHLGNGECTIEIEQNAFARCSSLTKFFVYGEPENCEDIFGKEDDYDVNEDLKIYVFSDFVDDFKNAEGWENYSDIIEAITVTANEGESGEYWATYYNEFAYVQMPSGTQVFMVTLEGTGITLTEIEDRIVNAGQGVVLKSNSASIELYTSDGEESSYDYDDNSLTGTMTEITNPGNAYVLNMTNENGVGFYKLSSGATIGANKAYLTYDGDLARESFLFGDGETTGIQTLDNLTISPIDNSVYDLQGRRVAQPTKGLYIVRSAEGRLQGKNGKKVIIK